MCCFSGRVREVGGTRIFAGAQAGGRQWLVYEMRAAFSGDVAMVLPQGPKGYFGVPLLRDLAQDSDATVWTLARALLARLLLPEDAPIVEPTLPPRRSAFSAEPPKTRAGR